MTKFDELRSTAFHEAGHALAAHVFGFPIERVTVEPDPPHTLGRVTLVNPDVVRDDLTKGIVFVLAGEAAERHLLGIKKVTGIEGDLAKVAEGYEELKQHCAVTKRAVPTVKELKALTGALVLKYRAPITNLAGCLMGCGSLDGLTVHQILQSAIDPQSSPLQPIRKRPKPTLAERLAGFGQAIL